MHPVEALLRAPPGLLPAGAHLLVAVSGGGDSCALLAALVHAAGWPLTVATVDHGLDEGSATRADFVTARADALGLPWRRLLTDPARVSRGRGPEDGARRERYRLLGACAAEVGATRVLTAHTADDQAETLIMRWADGAGLTGARGIPARRGLIARPWLGVPRASVRDWARARGVRWVEDPSNADLRFRRNALRPALAGLDTALGPAWVAGLARTAENLAADAEALRYFFDACIGDALRADATGATLALDTLPGAPPGALRHALVRLCAAAADEEARPGAAAIAALEDLAFGGAGRRRDLGGGLTGVRSRGHLSVVRASARAAVGAREPVDAALVVPGSAALGAWRVHAELLDELPVADARGDGCVATGTLEGPWLLRRAAPRERFRPLGSPGHRPLGRLWAEAGFDAADRVGLPVVEVSGHLVWAAGLRVADHARVQPGGPAVRLRAHR